MAHHDEGVYGIDLAGVDIPRKEARGGLSVCYSGLLPPPTGSHRSPTRDPDRNTLLTTAPRDLLLKYQSGCQLKLVGIHSGVTPMPTWSFMEGVATDLARECPHVTVITGIHLHAVERRNVDWHDLVQQIVRPVGPVVLVGVAPGQVSLDLAERTADWVSERVNKEMKSGGGKWGVLVTHYEISCEYRPPGQSDPSYKIEHYPANIADMVYPDFSDVQTAAGQLMGRSVGVAGLERSGSSGFTLRATFPDGRRKYFLTTAHHVVARDSNPIEPSATRASINIESPSKNDHDGWVTSFTKSLHAMENDPQYLSLVEKERANVLLLGRAHLEMKRKAIKTVRSSKKVADSYDRLLGTVYRSSGDDKLHEGWLRDWALIELVPRLAQQELVLHNILSSAMALQFQDWDYWESAVKEASLPACYLLGRTSMFNAGSFNQFPTYVWYQARSGGQLMTKTMLVVSSAELTTRFATFSQPSDSGGAILDECHKPVGVLWGGAREPRGSLKKRADGMIRQENPYGLDGLHFVLPLKAMLEDIRRTLSRDHHGKVEVELVGTQESGMSIEFKSQEDQTTEYRQRLTERP